MNKKVITEKAGLSTSDNLMQGGIRMGETSIKAVGGRKRNRPHYLSREGLKMDVIYLLYCKYHGFPCIFGERRL